MQGKFGADLGPVGRPDAVTKKDASQAGGSGEKKVKSGSTAFRDWSCNEGAGGQGSGRRIRNASRVNQAIAIDDIQDTSLEGYDAAQIVCDGASAPTAGAIGISAVRNPIAIGISGELILVETDRIHFVLSGSKYDWGWERIKCLVPHGECGVGVYVGLERVGKTGDGSSDPIRDFGNSNLNVQVRGVPVVEYTKIFHGDRSTDGEDLCQVAD